MSGELPHGWIWSTLGEVCHNPQYGWTTKASKTGSLQLVRTTDITSGTINWDSVPFCEKEPEDKEKYLLKDGDIIISRAGSVGYSLLIKSPQHSVFASYLIRFMPLIDRNFIAYFLKSPYYWNSISESKIGIAVPNVNATKLKQVSIPIAPLNEQHRIVAKIEELFTKLDAGVEALKKVQSQLKRYRQSVLKAALEGRLTAEWREQHLPAPNNVRQAGKDELEPANKLLESIHEERKAKLGKKYIELEQVDTSDLPKLPEKWTWAYVKQIGDVITGTTPSKSIPEFYGGEFPFYKPTDLNAGYFVKKSTDSLTIEGICNARLLPEDTTLVTCIGATIGKTGLIKKPGASNQQINAIIPESQINPKFIYFLCISPFFQNQILSKASSTTLPILNKSKFEKLVLMLPPYKEQKMIVSEFEHLFSIIDESELVLKSELKRAQSLRQSILKRAFEGKLVPQDAEDPPASILLEKIKAEKAKPKKSKQLEMF